MRRHDVAGYQGDAQAGGGEGRGGWPLFGTYRHPGLEPGCGTGLGEDVGQTALGAEVNPFPLREIGHPYRGRVGGQVEVGRSDVPAGYVGRTAARHAFAAAAVRPEDVDVAEFYDPFSFEIIRQLEAFGFCDDGEGGAFVEEGNIAPGGRLPVTTDGGTMSYSHAGINAQQLQRVIRGVEQLQHLLLQRATGHA